MWPGWPVDPRTLIGVIDELVASGLAARCLASDGGMPMVAERPFLQRRWAGSETVTTAVRDDDGGLVAAGAVRPGPVFTGLVDPSARGRGIGGRLRDWGQAEAAWRGGPVTVETEGLTPAAEELFAARGLIRVFGEHVMRFDLADPVEAPVWPAGTTLLTWSDETIPRFFAVYRAAFRERPGFPDWSMAEWADDDIRPEWSVLATAGDLGDAGFVTGDEGWLNQVGVLPPARGRGLGAALVREFLSRMRACGGVEAWLNVGVDNPAAGLYRRLGFTDRGVRARYATPAT
jgi:ribosomal protein S18 acetylase RimI-like enzyme